jgi:exopolyphosphatase / guanosine-5'-triphosphate,3'-diphosphate pyrophosphatase
MMPQSGAATVARRRAPFAWLAMRPAAGYARRAVRCACIDIGSNTTRLLVADVAAGADAGGGPLLAAVAERRAFSRLGDACRPGGAVPAAARAALAVVVAEQAAEARALGAEALRVVATAALRRSEDGLATCHALAAAAGAPVELLGEHDEARLAFAGATCGLAFEGPLAVVDVGGGSAQLVAGTCGGGAAWSVSLPLGSGDLAAAHLRGDPPAADELAALRAEAARALAGIAPPPVERALAVGGSATSLRRLAGSRLDAAGLERALATLVTAPAEVVAERTRIAPERVRLLPAGIVVLAAVAERLGPLEVARGGLREGVLRELAGA